MDTLGSLASTLYLYAWLLNFYTIWIRLGRQVLYCMNTHGSSASILYWYAWVLNCFTKAICVGWKLPTMRICFGRQSIWYTNTLRFLKCFSLWTGLSPERLLYINAIRSFRAFIGAWVFDGEVLYCNGTNLSLIEVFWFYPHPWGYCLVGGLWVL